MLKKFFRHPTTQAILTRLIAALMWFTGISSRIVYVGDSALPYIREGKPFIACFWHGRMFMHPYIWRHYSKKHGFNRKLYMMISAHGDGRFISKIISFFGVPTITGSTSRGGANALRNTVDLLKQNKIVAITPDGPRGPRCIAAHGVVQAARLANCPIIPVSHSSSFHKQFNSWDRFYLALPFGKIIFVQGAPIEPPKSDDPEEIERVLKIVEKETNKVQELGDNLC